jgi:hypothetical protein
VGTKDMPISLKDFNKTEFQGLYISKETFGDKGNKYIGRFQVNNKKYMKVLGYSHINHMNNFKAYELLNEYQDNISHSTKQTNHYHLIPQSDAYIVIDDNEIELDDLIEDFNRMKDIVSDFFPLVADSQEFIENMQHIYKMELLKQYEIEMTKVSSYLQKSSKKVLISLYSQNENLLNSIIKSVTKNLNSETFNVVSKKDLVFKQASDYIPFLPPIGKIAIFDHKIDEFNKFEQIDTIAIECHIDKLNLDNELIKVDVLKSILKNIDYDLKNRRLSF